MRISRTSGQRTVFFPKKRQRVTCSLSAATKVAPGRNPIRVVTNGINRNSIPNIANTGLDRNIRMPPDSQSRISRTPRTKNGRLAGSVIGCSALAFACSSPKLRMRRPPGQRVPTCNAADRNASEDYSHIRTLKLGIRRGSRTCRQLAITLLVPQLPARPFPRFFVRAHNKAQAGSSVLRRSRRTRGENSRVTHLDHSDG